MSFYRIATILILISACEENPFMASRQECEQLRERMIELRMQPIAEDQDQHRAALTASLGEMFISTCSETMTRKQALCGANASDLSVLEACNR